LVIYKCKSISDAGVLEIVNNSNGIRLNTLDISECDNITSIGYDAIRQFIK
jgi:hypothetical protein